MFSKLARYTEEQPLNKQVVYGQGHSPTGRKIKARATSDGHVLATKAALAHLATQHTGSVINSSKMLQNKSKY